MNNFFYTKCFILLIFGTFSCGNFDCNDQQYENLKMLKGEGEDAKKQNISNEKNNSQNNKEYEKNNEKNSNKTITNNEEITNNDINAFVNSDSQPDNNEKDDNVVFNNLFESIDKHSPLVNITEKKKDNDAYKIFYREDLKEIISYEEDLEDIVLPNIINDGIYADKVSYKSEKPRYTVNNCEFQKINETSYYCGDSNKGIGQKKIGQVYYTGQFSGDQEMNGFGVINNTQNGTLYAGQVKDDQPCGLGFLRTSDRSWKFGNFENLCIDPFVSTFTFISGFKYDSHTPRSYNFDFDHGKLIHEFSFNQELFPSKDNIQHSSFITSKSQLSGGIDTNNDLWIRVVNIELKLNRKGTNIKALYCYDNRDKKDDNYHKFIKIDFDDTSLIEFDNTNKMKYYEKKYQNILKAKYGDPRSLYSIKKISYAGDLRLLYGFIPYDKDFSQWNKLNSWSWEDLENIDKCACRKIGLDSSNKPYFSTDIMCNDILHNESQIYTLTICDERISFKENNNKISITYDESSKIKASKNNNDTENVNVIQYLKPLDNKMLIKVLLGDIFGEKIHLQYEWKLDDIFNNNSQSQNKIKLSEPEINKLRQKIIEKIQELGNYKLITSDSKVPGVQKYSLGIIGERRYNLFIKLKGNKFLIHNSIGSFE